MPACHYCFVLSLWERNPALGGQTHSYGNIEGSLTPNSLPVIVGYCRKKKISAKSGNHIYAVLNFIISQRLVLENPCESDTMAAFLFVLDVELKGFSSHCSSQGVLAGSRRL